MILHMAKVRILGHRPLLDHALFALQDAGLLHLAQSDGGRDLVPLRLAPAQQQELRDLHDALEDVEATLGLLGDAYEGQVGAPSSADPRQFESWSSLAARLLPRAERLRQGIAGLEEERALVQKYRPYLTAFGALLATEGSWTNAAVYHLFLNREETDVVARLGQSLEGAFGPEFALLHQTLPGGEVALLLVVTRRLASRVEAVLNEVRVQEVRVPSSFGDSLADAAPFMLGRLEAIPAEIEDLKNELGLLAREQGLELQRARAALRDRIAELDALPLSLVTERAFILEGWLPLKDEQHLRHRLASEFGDEVVVEVVPRGEWAEQEPPVLLDNPRFLQPFEKVMGLLPPPRYGSVDPTPFVALFFPLFFGLMLGDIGYGLLVLLLALTVRRRAAEGSLARSLSEVAGVCGVSAVLFGLAFGELFGDLGHARFGLQPLLMNREEELLAFLAIAVGLGFAHIMLGLLLGVVTSVRVCKNRTAAARGVTAALLLSGGAAVLSLAGVLPSSVAVPAAVLAALGLVPLVYYEGFIGPVELLSTVGNVLSYARIMALGTASVMLAVVANQLAEAPGNLALGILIGLLFHSVNLVLGLFSPTIHSLRLHYVEFFGKFLLTGGSPFRPFTHWRPHPRPER